MTKDISYYYGKVIVKNALKALRELPDESVDCVVTSPPYYLQRLYPPDANDVWDGDPNCEHEWVEYELKEGNRSGYVNPEKANTGKDKKALGKFSITGVFCKKCGAWYGQLGLEPHPELYVKHLADIFDEIYRVLKPTGTVWLNLGDTYWGGGRGLDVKKASKDGTYENLPRPKWTYDSWLKRKQLLLIPYRVAIELQERGWRVRDIIIWAKSVWFVKENDTKGNAMPESVKDRFKRSHEVILLLTKSDKYYFNLDMVKVPTKTSSTSKPNVQKIVQKLEELRNKGVLEIDDVNKVLEVYDEKALKELEKALEQLSTSKFAISDYQYFSSPVGRVLLDILKGRLVVRKREIPLEKRKEICRWLNEVRKQKGITIREVAEKLGVRKTIVEHWFRSDDYCTVPPPEYWNKLKELFGLKETPYDDIVLKVVKKPVVLKSTGKNPGNVWQINLEGFRGAHFAVFPKLLVVPCILAGCPPDGVVLDPFMGSGTVAVVVELINRHRWDKLRYPANKLVKSTKWNLKWIGIEPVREYVNLIVKRLREEVGLNIKPEDVIIK